MSLICFKTSATTYGCVSNDTGYIYPNEAYGTTYEASPVAYVGTGDFCRPSYKGNCRIRSRVDCRQCTGPVNEGSNWNQDIWYYQAGKEYSYIDCPIDTEIGFLLIGVLGMGVFFIRKNKKLVINPY
ncbi:hypothetical protein FA048_09655 [Pedobacter polaris]|uniref:Uncharacterized protein n=1 Tax=Pedobacter polaris TaxID=2571273 RepID=A0A4U1CQY3_9SPHI|nr:hypothetical protein [Pedobacter polaris]TKC10441.1 hypothetical protein FA048_09655 [Pedobacter polaris]